MDEANELRKNVYLHSENKPELEGGCFVNGVNHKLKKPVYQQIRIKHSDYYDACIFGPPQYSSKPIKLLKNIIHYGVKPE